MLSRRIHLCMTRVAVFPKNIFVCTLFKSKMCDRSSTICAIVYVRNICNYMKSQDKKLIFSLNILSRAPVLRPGSADISKQIHKFHNTLLRACTAASAELPNAP